MLRVAVYHAYPPGQVVPVSADGLVGDDDETGPSHRRVTLRKRTVTLAAACPWAWRRRELGDRSSSIQMPDL